jgi:hypothetical protein
MRGCVSTRLLRWYPLQCRHTVRHRYRCALTASLRAIAPALVGVQGFAFLRGGTTAWAPLAAIASWHLRVSYAPSVARQSFARQTMRGSGDTADVLIKRDLVQEFGQHGSIPDVAARDFDCPHFQRFFVDPYVYLAPYAAFRTTMLTRLHPPLPGSALRSNVTRGALIPVLSIRISNGPALPRYGKLTFSIFWRRQRVLKSGTDQSSPTNRSKL